MQMCAFLKEHMRVDHVFCALGLPQQAKHATSAKQLVIWDFCL